MMLDLAINIPPLWQMSVRNMPATRRQDPLTAACGQTLRRIDMDASFQLYGANDLSALHGSNVLLKLSRIEVDC